MRTKTSTLDAELLLLMTRQDREALADRARSEQKSSNEIARIAIRTYLANTTNKSKSAAA